MPVVLQAREEVNMRLHFVLCRSSRPEVFCEFAKFLRTPFFTEHLWWLLLFFEERSNNYNESGMVSDAISASKQTFRIKTNP